MRDIKYLFADQCGKIMNCTNQLTHITHFIIVPANGFYQLFIADGHHFSLRSIEQRTKMNANDIAAYDFIFGISEAFIAAAFIAALISSTVTFFFRMRSKFSK